MANRRPAVFIGSSSEGLSIAKAIQILLDRSSEITIWQQGVFCLSQGTLEALVTCVGNFDFAILILTPDELVASRTALASAPRDNVIFELGLFMGALGPNRTFIVYDRTADLKLPSDLAGVTAATYEPHSSGNLQSALGAATAMIENQIAKLGVTDGRPGSPEQASRLESLLQTLGTQIQELRLGANAPAQSTVIDEVDEGYRLLAEEFFRSVPLKKAQEEARTAKKLVAEIQKTQEVEFFFNAIKGEAEKLALAYNHSAKDVVLEIDNREVPKNLFSSPPDHVAYVLFKFFGHKYWIVIIVFYSNRVAAIQFVRMLPPDGSAKIETMCLTNDSINFAFINDKFAVSLNQSISDAVRANVTRDLPEGLQLLSDLQKVATQLTRQIIEYELLSLK